MADQYWPQPVRRQYIPKPDGTQRPLGIPTVRDRVVQAAVKIVVEPIFEAGFKASSYGFRPKKNATGALETIRLVGGRGHRYVVDGDIRTFFDSIDHEKLLLLVAQRVSDRRVLKLLRLWLKAGVLVEGRIEGTDLGSPQGGVISPLLANIYLDALDRIWERRCRHLGQLVRYADDFVVLCRTRKAAEESLRRIGIILERLSLKLHPDKTRIVELGLGKQGFVFLGCYLRIVLSHFKRREYLFRWPSPKAMNRIRARIRALTDRSRWSFSTLRSDTRCATSSSSFSWSMLSKNGLTVVELERRDGLRLHVRGVDMLDGTPLLDVKPYLSSIPLERIRRGWLDAADARRAAKP